MTSEELKARYGESDGGHFRIIDTIGVPHLYMVGSRHVVHASEHFSGILGEAAIESGERKGITCCMRACRLSYKEHGMALLVSCTAAVSEDDKRVNPELRRYLMACKPLAEADNMAGFAFKDDRPKAEQSDVAR